MQPHPQAKAKWLEFWRRLDARRDPLPYFAALEDRYAEPHRAYHSLAHVLDCLEELELARSQGLNRAGTRNASAMEMAIWYHDVIYDTRARDNEEQSAALAAGVIGEIGLDEAFKNTVAALILATKTHDASLGADAPLMVDVDLAILGRSPEGFDRYEAQIRREYNWVADDAFAAGRTAILETFLRRPTIYHLDFFRTRYEAQARRNLRRSIKRLSARK
jgi:predicted metal-dependent HD superfamily phosphohydrolase